MTTIEKIHAEFDSAQDRLLSEALTILNEKNNLVVTMSERLKAVGFSNTPIAKSGEQVREKLVKSTEQAELIQYYQYNYPFLKFLTEGELDRICAKYKLVYAPVANYIKDVPEKNLRDIEIAQKLKDTDSPKDLIYCELKRDESFKYFPLNSGWMSIFSPDWDKIPTRVDGIHFSHWVEADRYLHRKYGFKAEYLIESVTNYTIERSGLFIAAPESHFNKNGLEKNGFGLFNVFKTEVKDPIVFRYVRGGIQVLTKWGAEGEDPSLVLPKMN